MSDAVKKGDLKEIISLWENGWEFNDYTMWEILII